MKGIATAVTALAFGASFFAATEHAPYALFPLALFGGVTIIFVALLEFSKR